MPECRAEDVEVAAACASQRQLTAADVDDARVHRTIGRRYGASLWLGRRYGASLWLGRRYGASLWLGRRYGASLWLGRRYGASLWLGRRYGASLWLGRSTRKRRSGSYCRSARSTMAFNKTSHPAVIHSGLASSTSLCEMPSMQGTKTIEAGATLER